MLQRLCDHLVGNVVDHVVVDDNPCAGTDLPPGSVPLVLHLLSSLQKIVSETGVRTTMSYASMQCNASNKNQQSHVQIANKVMNVN
jgi:hypothetical protein